MQAVTLGDGAQGLIKAFFVGGEQRPVLIGIFVEVRVPCRPPSQQKPNENSSRMAAAITEPPLPRSPGESGESRGKEQNTSQRVTTLHLPISALLFPSPFPGR